MIRNWLEQMINGDAGAYFYILDFDRFNWLLTHTLLHFKQETRSTPLDYRFRDVWIKGMYYEYGTEYSVYVYRVSGATCAIKFKGDAATWIFANGSVL